MTRQTFTPWNRSSSRRAQANLDGMQRCINCPAILPSRGCPADGVTAPARRRGRSEPEHRHRCPLTVIRDDRPGDTYWARVTEGVGQGPGREAREFSLPGPFPAPPWLDQGVWPRRDPARVSGHARIHPRSRHGTVRSGVRRRRRFKSDRDPLVSVVWTGDKATDRELTATICAGCLVAHECLELAFRTAGLTTLGVWGPLADDDQHAAYLAWLQRRDGGRR